MNPRAWRVGLFAVAGAALLMLAMALVGGHWFARTERARLQFAVSVWGLQPGAPVVFRGVRVGQVDRIGLAPPGPQGPSLPVTVVLDRTLLQGLLRTPAAASEPVVPLLVEQGLVGRLAPQSLLTGLLYVELDLVAPAPPAGASASGISGSDGLAVIPTERTRLQSLQAQLEGLDIAQLGRDLQEVSTALRRMLADPQAVQSLARAAEAGAAVQRLAARLERELPPLMQHARTALDGSRRALDESRQAVVGSAAPALRQAAEAVTAAAAQVGSLADAGRPTLDGARRALEEARAALEEARRASVEVRRGAETLRLAADEEGGLRQSTERALQDVSRAARAVRELADLLDRQPDALLRGRRVEDPQTPR